MAQFVLYYRQYAPGWADPGNEKHAATIGAAVHTDVNCAGIFPKKAIQGRNFGQMGACFVMEFLKLRPNHERSNDTIWLKN